MDDPGAQIAPPDPADSERPERTRAPRKRARRLLWLRWYGFPKRSEAAWHLTQLGKHLRSLTGFRP